MSLEEIRKRIDSEAKSEAERVSEKGRAEADAILAKAREEAEVILKTAKSEAEREASRIKREMVSAAEIEASALLLGAREYVVDGCIVQVKKQVEERLSDTKALGKLIGGAAAEFEALVARKDMVVKAGGPALKDVRKMGFVAKEGEEGELSITSRDGSMALDVSPHSLADKYEPEGRNLLAQKIFGSGR